uniref:Uncharacterized protein n=1 Tax=Triticum urartu TaxID=4572 RepID=A0A8R7PD94_TRIUA
MPWMTPSGLTTASGRVTSAVPTSILWPSADSWRCSPESVIRAVEAGQAECECRREGRTWKRSRRWRERRLRGSRRKARNSGSRSRSRASFRGAKMVTLPRPTASSSDCSSSAFSTSSASSV